MNRPDFHYADQMMSSTTDLVSISFIISSIATCLQQQTDNSYTFTHMPSVMLLDRQAVYRTVAQ